MQLSIAEFRAGVAILMARVPLSPQILFFVVNCNFELEAEPVVPLLSCLLQTTIVPVMQQVWPRENFVRRILAFKFEEDWYCEFKDSSIERIKLNDSIQYPFTLAKTFLYVTPSELTPYKLCI